MFKPPGKKPEVAQIAAFDSVPWKTKTYLVLLVNSEAVDNPFFVAASTFRG